MTDPTQSISAALREAHLQRLEASLASKAVAKPQNTDAGTTKRDDSNVRDLSLTVVGFPYQYAILTKPVQGW